MHTMVHNLLCIHILHIIIGADSAGANRIYRTLYCENRLFAHYATNLHGYITFKSILIALTDHM